MILIEDTSLVSLLGLTFAEQELLAVALGAKAGSYPSQLSGGQQQRVALGRRTNRGGG